MATTTTGEHIPLATQVGGHAGVLSSADGKLIIKPCLSAEKAFYDKLQAASEGNEADRGLVALRLLSPEYHGIIPSVQEGGKDIIVLENLSAPFKKPNILDIKLGTVLYDDDATQDKKERMIKSAKETTSFETGVRITGFTVWDYLTGQYVATDKPYGRALKAEQLPEAMAKFFPVATPTLNLSSTTDSGTGLPSSPAGLPARLLLPILRGILQNVTEIEAAFQKIELRMVGGSALFIYEGDPDVLEAASGSEGTLTWKVKMIDYAHTRMAPGEGTDEGVLKGLKNVVSLIEGRIREVEEVLGSVENVSDV